MVSLIIWMTKPAYNRIEGLALGMAVVAWARGNWIEVAILIVVAVLLNALLKWVVHG